MGSGGGGGLRVGTCFPSNRADPLPRTPAQPALPPPTFPARGKQSTRLEDKI